MFKATEEAQRPRLAAPLQPLLYLGTTSYERYLGISGGRQIPSCSPNLIRQRNAWSYVNRLMTTNGLRLASLLTLYQRRVPEHERLRLLATRALTAVQQ